MTVAIVPWGDTPPNRARHSAKVLELMAAGLPIVAYAVGELPATLGGAGVLAPPGDADGFAAAVAALLADPDRAARLGRAARARVQAHFTWERLADLALAAYRPGWRRSLRILWKTPASRQNRSLVPPKDNIPGRPDRALGRGRGLDGIDLLSLRAAAAAEPAATGTAANPGRHRAFHRVCGAGRAGVVGITGGRDSPSVSMGSGATVLYSLTDEFHQSFVPNRHPDVFDLATDFAGAVTALFIVRWLGVRRGHA